MSFTATPMRTVRRASILASSFGSEAKELLHLSRNTANTFVRVNCTASPPSPVGTGHPSTESNNMPVTTCTRVLA